jgi:hypothetical protein
LPSSSLVRRMPPRLRGFLRSPGRRSERGMVRIEGSGSSLEAANSPPPPRKGHPPPQRQALHRPQITATLAL